MSMTDQQIRNWFDLTQITIKQLALKAGKSRAEITRILRAA